MLLNIIMTFQMIMGIIFFVLQIITNLETQTQVRSIVLQKTLKKYMLEIKVVSLFLQKKNCLMAIGKGKDLDVGEFIQTIIKSYFLLSMIG